MATFVAQVACTLPKELGGHYVDAGFQIEAEKAPCSHFKALKPAVEAPKVEVPAKSVKTSKPLDLA
jgi:hypothetical protein